MNQEFGICRIAVAPLRAEPSDKAEIISQLLFGDSVEVLQKLAQWWQVRNAYDQYEGWMDYKQLASISSEVYGKKPDFEYMTPAEPINIVVDGDGSKYYLSPGSNLPLYQDGFCYLGEEKYEVLFQPKKVLAGVAGAITETALLFQNVPYLWGGRNLFGMDCSGFTQIVFKLNGIRLNRDTWQQAEQGETVDFLTEVQPGDVAFFDNDAGRIIHVGIMLNNTDIIHASGKVRIDKIDDQGIYNAELGKYTHKLRIIKRFV